MGVLRWQYQYLGVALMKILIFDDVVFARGETFNLPGLEVHVFEHADDAVVLADALDADFIFMDYSMGASHVSGAEAVAALRGAGYPKSIVAISSDPLSNAEMIAVGASEKLATKAMLRSYLANLGAAQASAGGADGEDP